MNSLIKYLIVDIQGIFVPEFFPKEICIRDGENGLIHHYIVRTPTPWHCLSKAIKRMNIYVEKNIHGIRYIFEDKHTIDIYQVENFLKSYSDVNVIFVKGSQKQEYLKDMLNRSNISIINLEHVEKCPKLASIQIDKDKACFLHHKTMFQCSFRNVLLLDNFIKSICNSE